MVKEFNYLKEKARMLKALGNTGTGWCNADCTKCPLSHWNNKSDCKCKVFEINYPNEATDAVRKWAEDHPARTRKDVLLERFPNVKRSKDGAPHVCAYYLGLATDEDYYEECVRGVMSCAKCWNKEVEE